MPATATQNGWIETTLGKVGKIVTGKTPSQKNPEYWGDFLNFITPTDFKSDSKYLSSVGRQLSKEGQGSLFRLLIPANSVIVTCIGSDMGKVVVNSNDCITNQQINSLVVDKDFDTDFVYYLLKNSYKILRQNAEGGGSTMPIINKTSFQNLSFSFPPLPEQKAIAAVLSSLDDKIELLREQNKTLEDIAQAIFKEWFVKFNFPNATGKMVDSELGEIPEGWRVGKISDFGNVVCGKTPSKSNKDYFGGHIPFIKIPDMHNKMYLINTIDSLTEKGGDSQKNKFIPPNSICVSCIATVGLVSITTKNSQTNQQINSIVPDKSEYIEYLYLLLLRSKDYLSDLGSGGTATLNVNTGIFSSIEVLFPNKRILKVFHKITKPLFEKILNNSSQIQTLSTMRDTLLPRMMSGDVRVEM